ncbi:hypothetical protein GMOD_00006493 [Pyrenophora seminiperda CCB06]|uniref:F-box domain-containing protein n=1 Tax=Pyrenophora seminiperda CCB06 TaxID=1302712 RepID=A0A3M7M5G3_9PLEO|nr:hypothetical protein GMOD_00006493 [Pyrenophora seminiperda CCB06]
MPPYGQLSSGVRKRRVLSPGLCITIPHLVRKPTIPEPALVSSAAATRHPLKARPETDEQTRQHGKHIGLLDLPSELLETIAFELYGSKSVLNFGLVNRRMNEVVRQATVRKLIVSKQIKAFLEMLGHRPVLINKVSHVDLGDFGCTHHEKCLCLGTASLNKEVMEVIGRAIAANNNNAVRWNHILEDRRSSGGIWRVRQAFFINVLTSLCPNIKSVKIELPEARKFTSAQPPRPIHLAPTSLPSLNLELLPVAPFQGPALAIMQQRLEVLTIAENTRWKGPATTEVLEGRDLQWRNMGTHTITLAGFSKLKRLDISMEALGRPHSIVFQDLNRPNDTMHNSAADVANTRLERKANGPEDSRVKIIPLTIRFLHIRSCGKWTFVFLQMVNKVPMEHLKLQLIELFLDTGPEHVIAKCTTMDESRFSYLQVLLELTRKGIKISFYTGVQAVPVNMVEVLLAISHISPIELWPFSISSMPWTSLNRESSMKRRSSTIGSRLFIRHAGYYFGLFNSPTFEVTLWTQCAFFHGVNDTKWDRHLGAFQAKPQLVFPEWAPKRSRRLPALLSKTRLQQDLDTFKFCFWGKKNVMQLPKEVFFLGAIFTFPENTCTQQVERMPNKDQRQDMKVFNQDHHAAQVAGTENDETRLSIHMTRLRLRPIRNDHTAAITTTNCVFNIYDWIGIEWRSVLQLKD